MTTQVQFLPFIKKRRRRITITTASEKNKNNYYRDLKIRTHVLKQLTKQQIYKLLTKGRRFLFS